MSDSIVEKTIALLHEQRYYDSIQGLMGWDLWEGLTEQGHNYRGEVTRYFTSQALERLKSPATARVVAELMERGDDGYADIYERGAARELIRRHQKAVQVPEDLQVQMRSYTAQAQMAWRDALKANRFKDYLPWMEGLFERKRRIASSIDSGSPPFDVLCGQVDDGIDTGETERLFAGLKQGIAELLPQVLEGQAAADISLLEAPHTQQQIRDLAYEINLLTGFDPGCAHDSRVLHGMSTGVGPRDIRIGISYKGIWGGIFTMLHEGGHARYSYSSCDRAVECGIWGGVSGSMQESQARFYENIIGRSPEFWQLCYPALVQRFPQYRHIPWHTFYQALMRVSPGVNRITADELTYSLHPILRYEMEKDYFDGKLRLADFEEVWNAKYKETFGLVPKDAREGVLQDIHWSSGHIGYFQSYTLGNLYGGQLLHAMKKEIPDFDRQILSGNFVPINQWLYNHIFQYGNALTPTELLVGATGEQLSERYYLNYLRERYRKKIVQ